MKLFYEPTAEHLTRLSEPWCCSFSGGKDSTSLVTWIEWLRRSGWIDVAKPKLVQSDTGVEDAALTQIAADMRALLEQSGWECTIVRPLVKDRLYVMILGRGVTPIHPGVRNMRWCTRSTKIDPMDRWRESISVDLTLTGVRLGESDQRDDKLKKRGIGCSAGGECGLPELSDTTYSPILRWKTCQVIDWLSGQVAKEVRRKIADILIITKRLIEIYDVEIKKTKGLFGEITEVTAARFGCVGCPAIEETNQAPPSYIARYGADSPLNELYEVWFEARRRVNRCCSVELKEGRYRTGFGPIKMEVRKVLFERVMDIQRRAGVVLITPEDEAFIQSCWANKVYPRGWSEEDEATPHPDDAPLFVGE